MLNMIKIIYLQPTVIKLIIIILMKFFPILIELQPQLKIEIKIDIIPIIAKIEVLEILIIKNFQINLIMII